MVTSSYQMKFIMLASLAVGVSARLLGNCNDEYGCATCAGYKWCEGLQKCVRLWEEKCDDVDYVSETNVEIMDYIIGNNNI